MDKGGFEALQGFKQQLLDQEPLFDAKGAEGRTTENLRSSTSQKLLKYLLQEYKDTATFQKYLRNDNNAFKIEKIEEALRSGNLSKTTGFALDDLYKQILMVAPITEQGNQSVYSRMAREAGCDESEEPLAVQILSSYRASVEKRFFHKGDPEANLK